MEQEEQRRPTSAAWKHRLTALIDKFSSSCREMTRRLLIQSRQKLICQQRDAAGGKLRDKKHSFSTKEVSNELRDDNRLLIMCDCDHEV